MKVQFPLKLILLPLVLFSLLLISPQLIWTQAAEARELIGWNDLRTGIQKGGMIALGSWAVGNIGLSGYLMTVRQGEEHYFHQMNLLWNLVNLSIAGFGYAGAVGSPLELDAAATLKEFGSFSRILAINAALDVAYITTGIIMRSRSGSSEKYGALLGGYGSSLILQGGFLLAFDLVMLLINQGAVGTFQASPEGALGAAGTQGAQGALVQAAMLPAGGVVRVAW